MHAATFSPPVQRVGQPSTVLVPKRSARLPGLSRLQRLGTLPGVAQLSRAIRASRGHGLWIAIWSVVGWVGTALSPALADHAFLVMLLSPRALFVALASNSVSLLPFVVLGTIRLSVTDASYFIIGRRLPGGSNDAPSTTKRVNRWTRTSRRIAREGDRVCRWFCSRPKLAGAFLFVRPNSKYLAVAGAYGISPWTAGISASTGTACFLAAMHLGIGAIF